MNQQQEFFEKLQKIVDKYQCSNDPIIKDASHVISSILDTTVRTVFTFNNGSISKYNLYADHNEYVFNVDLDSDYGNIIDVIVDPTITSSYFSLLSDAGRLRIIHDKFMVIYEKFGTKDVTDFRMAFRNYIINRFVNRSDPNDVAETIKLLEWYNGTHTDRTVIDAMKLLTNIKKDRELMGPIYNKLIGLVMGGL